MFQPVVSVLILLPIVLFSSGLYKAERDMYVLKSISNPAYPENNPAVQKFGNQVLSNSIADPFYKYRLAFFLYDMGYQEEAYSHVSKSLATDPTNLEFLTGMIFLEESKNNIENVILLRNRIAALDPWNADNYLQLSKLYRASGDLVNAEAMKSKILSFAPGTDIAKTASETIG